MRRPGLLIAVFAFAASFFGWETYSALTAGSPRSDPPVAGFTVPARPDAFGDNASRAADPGLLVAVIAARPLFRPGREPFHENAAVAVQRNYDLELSRFSLVGVLLQGDTKKGIVLGTAPGARDRWEVAPGDSLPGFAVKDVQADALVVTADGKDFLLPLYAGGPKGQPGASLRTDGSAAPAPGQGPGVAMAPAPGQGPGTPISRGFTPPPVYNPPATPVPGAGASQTPAGAYVPPFAIKNPSRPTRVAPPWQR